MAGQNYIEEIDCASFFDQIDDLIDFPPVNDTALDTVDCNAFPTAWTDNSGGLKVPESVFIGSKGDNVSNLSAEIAVPVS